MRLIHTLLALLIIQNCTVAPTYNNNWNNNNCSSLPYFTPDTKSYSNCTQTISSSGKSYSCNQKEGKYIGQLKNSKYHGKGKYIFKNGSAFKGTFKNGDKWCGVEKSATSNSFYLYKDGIVSSDEAGVDWGTVAAAVVIAGAAYAIAESSSGSGGSPSSSSNNSVNCSYTYNYTEYTIKNPNGWGECPSYNSYEVPQMCSIYSYESPKCDTGKACGNSCISKYDTCHVGKGSACNENYRTYP